MTDKQVSNITAPLWVMVGLIFLYVTAAQPSLSALFMGAGLFGLVVVILFCLVMAVIAWRRERKYKKLVAGE